MKTKVARGLALANLLATVCISCGASESLPLGCIVLSAIVFLGSAVFWAEKGGLFK